MDVNKWDLFLEVISKQPVWKEIGMDENKWKMFLEKKIKPYPFSDFYGPSGIIEILRREVAPPESYPRLLCVGCGAGFEVEYANKVGYKAVGITLGEENVRKGRERGLEIYHMDMHDLKFPPDSFDVALNNHSLEHAFFLPMVAVEVYCTLRERGRWYIELPPSHVHNPSPDKSHLDPNHMCLFIPDSLQRMLEFSGWKTLKRIATNIHYRFYLEKKTLKEIEESLPHMRNWMVDIIEKRLQYGRENYV
jgi:SAM-dependent methyltransferase